MTERQVQYIVSQVIAATELTPEKYYHVCWCQEQIRCHHVRHTKDLHEVFYSAPGHVFIDGLSAYQWRLVTTRIVDFCWSHGITLDLDSGRRKKSFAHKTPPRRVTEFDSMRLRSLLASARAPQSDLNPHLDKLQQLLETAEIVAQREVPGDVVTMNSRVRLKDDRVNDEMVMSLVFPADAVGDTDPAEFCISVLSPLGLSLLGRKAGDVVEGRLRVDELLYQPEAAGDFHL